MAMSRLLAGVLLLAGGPVVAAERPNVVIILADALGYGSVACYGGTGLQTPNATGRPAADDLLRAIHPNRPIVFHPSRP
jgi:hypothetical protein